MLFAQILSFVIYLKIMGSFDNSPFSTTVSYIFQFSEVSLINSLVHFFPEFYAHTHTHTQHTEHTHSDTLTGTYHRHTQTMSPMETSLGV